MSLTNQERTRMINAINGTDVRIIAISTGLLDAIDLKRFLPSSVNGLLHKHCSTSLFSGQTMKAKAGTV